MYGHHLAYILREENCRMLINYPAARSTNKFWPDIPHGFSEVLIDSGGFQMQTGVAEVYLGAYALWLKLLLPNHPEIVGYMNIDVAGDPIKTMENLLYMEKEGLHPLPVWHEGHGMEYLDFYCSNYEWIAVGGFIAKSINSIRDFGEFHSGESHGSHHYLDLLTLLTGLYPKNKFHLFGIGLSGIEAYKQIRAYSCDFNTWSAIGMFGHAIIRDNKRIIKEVAMSESDRQRLRTDKKFLADVTREGVKNIKYFEDTLTKMENTEHKYLLF